MTSQRQVRLTAAGLLAAIAIGVVTLSAAERRPLPPMTLQSLDGQVVSVSDVAMQGNWLLLYVEPSCGACEAILSAMTAEDHPGMAQRVAVIVGGATLEQASAMAAKSELGAAKWVLNPDRSARTALNVKQAPMTIGIRSNMIEWTLTGVLRKSAEMTSVLVSWLNQPLPPQPPPPGVD
jgi:hypothetical protein